MQQEQEIEARRLAGKTKIKVKAAGAGKPGSEKKRKAKSAFNARSGGSRANAGSVPPGKPSSRAKQGKNQPSTGQNKRGARSKKILLLTNKYRIRDGLGKCQACSKTVRILLHFDKSHIGPVDLCEKCAKLHWKHSKPRSQWVQVVSGGGFETKRRRH